MSVGLIEGPQRCKSWGWVPQTSTDYGMGPLRSHVVVLPVPLPGDLYSSHYSREYGIVLSVFLPVSYNGETSPSCATLKTSHLSYLY